MRVIAGLAKGCRLVAPVGTVARPTTDRVKESMFNLMGVGWQGGIVLDLFAGSGALGIEALCRGALHGVFVDKNQRCVEAVRDNLRRCHILEREGDEATAHEAPTAEVMRMDWSNALSVVSQRWSEVGWVFLDPPYPKNLWESVLNALGHGTLLVKFGVVCEHPKDAMLPDDVGRLTLWKRKYYGDIGVSIYREPMSLT